MIVLKTVEVAFILNNMKIFSVYVAIESHFLQIRCIAYKREAYYLRLRSSARIGDARGTEEVPMLPFSALGSSGGKNSY